jgi:hypothetical protein
MSGWSCNSGFGPRPSVGTTPLSTLNGLAGPSMSAKKNAHTTSMARTAQATSGSVTRSRKRQQTATV